MAREPIKDFHGRIHGWLETKPNGDVVATDFHGRILGYYIAALDRTQDFHGRILSTGNTVASLIL